MDLNYKNELKQLGKKELEDCIEALNDNIEYAKANIVKMENDIKEITAIIKDSVSNAVEAVQETIEEVVAVVKNETTEEPEVVEAPEVVEEVVEEPVKKPAAKKTTKKVSDR